MPVSATVKAMLITGARVGVALGDGIQMKRLQ